MPSTFVSMAPNSPRMFEGASGLRIPDVDVAGAALEEEQDDGLGAAEALAAGEGVHRRGGGVGVAERQGLAEGDAEDAERADAEELPPGRAVAGVAGLSWDDEHVGAPLRLRASAYELKRKGVRVEKRPHQVLGGGSAAAGGLEVTFGERGFIVGGG